MRNNSNNKSSPVLISCDDSRPLVTWYLIGHWTPREATRTMIGYLFLISTQLPSHWLITFLLSIWVALEGSVGLICVYFPFYGIEMACLWCAVDCEGCGRMEGALTDGRRVTEDEGRTQREWMTDAVCVWGRLRVERLVSVKATSCVCMCVHFYLCFLILIIQSLCPGLLGFWWGGTWWVC